MAAFAEQIWLRESCSWEELRLGAPFRRNCEKDRRAEAENSLLTSSACWLEAACSLTDYKLARILLNLYRLGSQIWAPYLTVF